MDGLETAKPQRKTAGQLHGFKVNEQLLLFQIPGIAQLIQTVVGGEVVSRQERQHTVAALHVLGNVGIPFHTGIDTFIVPHPEAIIDQCFDNGDDLVKVSVGVADKDKGFCTPVGNDAKGLLFSCPFHFQITCHSHASCLFWII